MLTEVLGAPHALAAIGAFAVAVTNNFLWNRRWTFAANAGPAGFQRSGSFSSAPASLGLNLAALELLLQTEAVSELTAQAIAVQLRRQQAVGVRLSTAPRLSSNF